MPLPKDSLFFGLGPKLTEEQKHYVDSIFDKQIVFVNAPAGTGKTTLAVACAKLLETDLFYTFSPVEEDKMGFRPGNQEEKNQAYLGPLYDALEEIGEDPLKSIYSEELARDPRYKRQISDLIKEGSIWVYAEPHTFLRGRNMRKTIIIDEAQNFTVSELKKVLTRVHDPYKVIVIGHSGQCDLPDPSQSGFTEYIEHFRNEPYAAVCTLTKNFRGIVAQHADKLVV